MAEVTQPSLGVGYELCYAENLDKKVVALFDKNSGRNLSAMIDGNSNLTVFRYDSVADAIKFVESELA